MAHAKLSPSAAERWMTCPGSIVLSDGMPQRTSAFAEEGTLAHEIAEKILNGWEPEGVDAEMLENVRVYTDYVQTLAVENTLHVETRVKCFPDLWGTADAVVWMPRRFELHVIDLKYGAGVPVEVANNLQLKIYALASMKTFGMAAQTVTTTIVQPRCPHPDGPVRSFTYDTIDLIEFNADLEDAIKTVQEAVNAYEN